MTSSPSGPLPSCLEGPHKQEDLGTYSIWNPHLVGPSDQDHQSGHIGHYAYVAFWGPSSWTSHSYIKAEALGLEAEPAEDAGGSDEAQHSGAWSKLGALQGLDENPGTSPWIMMTGCFQ